MPRYLRAKGPGNQYFFTVVTYDRRPILTWPESRAALRQAVITARKGAPFGIDAWVLLPDHLHCVWSLPEYDKNYPRRWNVIKSTFSRLMKSRLHDETPVSASRARHRELTIWQRRYWEHQIRDDDDLHRHFDYIHFNPLKHGLVTRIRDWPYSTFHRFVADGTYPDDWAGSDLSDDDAGFGE
jgi:putative transposase